MYLSYVGIRVTDLARSLKFYKGALGLEEVARGDNSKSGAGVFVLLRDRKSRMKLELNWYPESSKYDTPYSAGEGLDHVAFCVDDLKKKYAQLVATGAGKTDFGPEAGASYCYVTDPDGNWIELYQHTKPPRRRIPRGY
ncbi:MAG: VOC family protein [Nitrososphaerota archaeon]|nr:VOC family protein [Nitrososphaerota archaeon]MDG7023461.1 VOC family protein [Nitrososphaerota archaeon]